MISCILIALEDEAFRTSYTKKTTPKSLADFLTKTVSEKLEEANISGKKLEHLNIQFGFIKTDTSLSTKDKVLKELIDEIDENINQFIKTHEYFDVLGQLYIEFLRYANSDKGLGLVLTPPHITELFAELAQVNKNSIAFDNCTGTGGFLISAMKKMIEDAKGDTERILSIKSKQLIGVEYQSHIFALAVSNMYIHQDGKTNIINGSCFEDAIIKEVKAKTKLTDSIRNAVGKVNGTEMVVSCMDFAFIGGSLGSVRGEKIRRAIDYCMDKKLPYMIICQSGGARMQEATYSLMQLAKVQSKLAQLSEAGLPYIAYLCDPTFGGITASFAMTADIIMAEPGALIGFAGPRVIRETIGKDLPEGFQTSEFLQEKGFVDFIVKRTEIKQTVSKTVNLLYKK